MSLNVGDGSYALNANVVNLLGLDEPLDGHLHVLCLVLDMLDGNDVLYGDTLRKEQKGERGIYL